MKTRAQIADARERRASLFAEMRAVTDKAETEKRDLTSEEAHEWDRLDGEIDSLDDEIRRAERELGLESRMSRDIANPDGEGDPNETREDAFFDMREGRYITGPEATSRIAARPTGSREYRDAFEALVRASRQGGIAVLSAEQRAAMQVGTDSEGGYLVPDEFYRQLQNSLREFGIVRELATVITTGDNGDLQVPSVATHMTAAWTAEEAAFTQSEPTVGQKILQSFKAGAISKISDELLLDSAFDVLAFLAQDAGQALALLENTAFVTGASGSTTTPEGIVKKATVGKTFAANNAITADELIDLYHSVISPYRDRAVWMMRDSTVSAVRKLKDTTNQYIWQPGLQAGQPDLLLGKPLRIDPDVPAIATVAESVVFGDIAGYWIRDVEGISVKVLNELYAANGQVGFRVHKRTDGDLVDTSAVKVGKHPA